MTRENELANALQDEADRIQAEALEGEADGLIRLLREAAAALSERVPEAITLAVNEALHEADNIILLLTADHNSGPHYVKGFELAQEYMFKRNKP